MADPVELLRNRDFAVDSGDGSATAFDGWLIVPNVRNGGTRVNDALRVDRENQLCGPLDYRPYPNAKLVASLDSSSAYFNFDSDARPAIIRIQVGTERYGKDATPATEPNILAEWRSPVAYMADFSDVALEATVPVTYDRDTDEPVCVVYWCADGGGGNNPTFTVVNPSLLLTDPGDGPDPDPGNGGDNGNGGEPGDGNGEQPPTTDAAQRVADFLGGGDDPTLVALAQESVTVITAMVRAYTRGNGFVGTEPCDELAAVITTASARLVANPEQLASDIGSVSIRGGFTGFSLAEMFVLNRYRVRAQ